MLNNNLSAKSVLTWAAALALFAGAYSALIYVRVYDRSIEPSSFRSFTVTGEGRVVAMPDVAEFTASVVTQGDRDLAVLQTSNTEKMNQIIAFIKTKGVDAKDIQTSGYRIEPRYQYYNCSINSGISSEREDACPPAKIVGYTITQTVRVKIRDFKKTGEILAGTVSAGANTVSEIVFTIDDPAELKSRARTEAILKAKSQAKVIAKAGGFSVGKLLALEEGSLGPIMAFEKFDRAGGAANLSLVAPIIEPGTQEIAVQITLRYEIN